MIMVMTMQVVKIIREGKMGEIGRVLIMIIEGEDFGMMIARICIGSKEGRKDLNLTTSLK